MYQLLFTFTFLILVIDEGYLALNNSEHLRIVGGEETTIEKHPYQVSLQRAKKHVCGATLIKANLALTAAHCIKDWNQLTIRAGTKFNEKGGVIANVKNGCIHPLFNKTVEDNQVLLNKRFRLSKTIKTIPLELKAEVPDGALGLVTGWRTAYEHGEISKILQKVNVPKVNQELCKTVHSYFNISITDRNVCFGYFNSGEGVYMADSGSPIVVNGKQVGIVSGGIGCGHLPEIYTKLSNKSIRKHIIKCMRKFKQ